MCLAFCFGAFKHQDAEIQEASVQLHLIWVSCRGIHLLQRCCVCVYGQGDGETDRHL